MNYQSKQQNRSDWNDFLTLLRSDRSPDAGIKKTLFLLGLLIAIIPIGSLFGFRFAYNKLGLQHDGDGKPPTLKGQPRIVYIAMVFMPILIIAAIIGLVILFKILYEVLSYDWQFLPRLIQLWILVNGFVSLLALFAFNRWQKGIENMIEEKKRYGTARFATNDELIPYHPENQPNGFFIGNGYYYDQPGHLLTVAGTRAGKGVNILAPNLLAPGHFKGSWVVIDPKGELAAITAAAQKAMGRKVVFLNPWDLLGLGMNTFNPLDILKTDRLNFTDDIAMIVESIIPIELGKDDHWKSRARSLVSTLLTHLVSYYPPEDRSLALIWAWLRLPTELWAKLLKEELLVNDHPDVGEIVRAGASEIINNMEKGEKEFSSILSTARDNTDFLRSPALRDNMTANADFKSSDLVDQDTIVYLIIPADRLKSQSRWLRLVFSTLMKSVVRNPKKDVCFLLDEFYALGYLSEIEIAFGSYAGYGVHLWPVTQNFIQLRDLYGNNWENIISSCSVKHYFNVDDNFTAEYISKSFGTLSWSNGMQSGASGRNLLNPDELMNQSGNTIYTRIDKLHPARFEKNPYWTLGLEEGKDYDKNPYYKPRNTEVEHQARMDQLRSMPKK